jgi:hypothetical protein
MAAYFQVPDDRSLQSTGSKIPSPWPASNDGYRLFVSGNSGEERIGIQLGQKIELQIVGGKDCWLVTEEWRGMRTKALAMDPDAATALATVALPELISISKGIVATDKETFVVNAVKPGATTLYAFDPSSNAPKAELKVVVGNFENHPGMKVDLIANVCRGSDSLRIHALQRMLNNNTFLGVDPLTGYNTFNNGDNIFEQHAAPNISPDPAIGGMSCGVVARWRTEQVFLKSLGPSFDWYIVGSIHERLRSHPTEREQVKYLSAKVEALRGNIAKALIDGSAVRAAVVDNPTTVLIQDGALVSYSSGGHTVVIVGCSDDSKEFLYIDPWGGGSQMEYKGGIPGAKFPGACLQIGKLMVANNPERRARPGDVGNNIIREHPDTQYTFSYGTGNYLEVVAAPFPVPGR